ncbi:MAG: hypothetical protein HOC20_06380 [Chloroflexi bacterium]|jgi:hypothetical protein|nr:hypothetical protein [Chloroflexota bacterium]
MKRNQCMIAIILLGSVLLGGCGEVYNEYYISNHSAESLAISLTPFYIENTDLSYGPLIEDIRVSERSALQQPVDYDQVGESLHFSLPSKSSLYLGFSSGGNELFSQLEISSESLQVVMDRDDYREYFEVYDRLVGAVVQVYNVR